MRLGGWRAQLPVRDGRVLAHPCWHKRKPRGIRPPAEEVGFARACASRCRRASSTAATAGEMRRPRQLEARWVRRPRHDAAGRVRGARTLPQNLEDVAAPAAEDEDVAAERVGRQGAQVVQHCAQRPGVTPSRTRTRAPRSSISTAMGDTAGAGCGATIVTGSSFAADMGAPRC